MRQKTSKKNIFLKRASFSDRILRFFFNLEKRLDGWLFYSMFISRDSTTTLNKI